MTVRAIHGIATTIMTDVVILISTAVCLMQSPGVGGSDKDGVYAQDLHLKPKSDKQSPAYLPIDEGHRRTYDRYIVKRDSGAMEGHPYIYNEYLIMPDPCKCKHSTFHAYAYTFNSSEITFVATDKDYTLIENVGNRVTVTHVGLRSDAPGWLEPQSIESIRKYLSFADSLPSARFDGNGIVESFRDKSWRFVFKKYYRVNGYGLTSTSKRERFGLFIEYPFTVNPDKKSISQRYKMTPPFLFFNLDDFFTFFSSMGSLHVTYIGFNEYNE